MDWPRTLPADLPWGERAMAARHVTPAIILSLWAPAEGPSIQPINDKLRQRINRERRGPLGRS